MSTFLPQFPLNIVVFPGENLNLHIFEERYKQLIHDCVEQEITFGIPTVIRKELKSFGTELKLAEIVKKHSNGSMDIKTQALGKYEILEFNEVSKDRLYGNALVRKLEDNFNPNKQKEIQIFALLNKLFELLKIGKPIPKIDEQIHTFLVGHHVGFNLDQEYEFLSLESELERQDYLIGHLRKLLPIVEEMENLKSRINMNGHFKDLKPPDF